MNSENDTCKLENKKLNEVPQAFHIYFDKDMDSSADVLLCV